MTGKREDPGLLPALRNPANQFFLSFVVLVRQLAVSLKEIT
jgi:hypothetical protein